MNPFLTLSKFLPLFYLILIKIHKMIIDSAVFVRASSSTSSIVLSENVHRSQINYSKSALSAELKMLLRDKNASFLQNWCWEIEGKNRYIAN